MTTTADEVLAVRSQTGDELAQRELLRRYTRRAHLVASAYFLPGAERDDLRQEALIGLLGGIRSFQLERHTGNFPGWLDLCVRRQVITAVKTANRAKHRPLNDGVLLSTPIMPRHAADDFRGTLGDALPDLCRDPHRELIDRDEFRGIIRFLSTELSALEHASLVGFLNGKSYRQIDAELVAAGDGDRDGRAQFNEIKVVDNALSRARRKARRFVEERDAA